MNRSEEMQSLKKCSACSQSYLNSESSSVEELQRRTTDLSELRQLSLNEKKELEEVMTTCRAADNRAEMIQRICASKEQLEKCLSKQVTIRSRLNEDKILLVKKALAISKSTETLHSLQRIRCQLEEKLSCQKMIRSLIQRDLQRSACVIDDVRWRRVVQVFAMMPIVVTKPPKTSHQTNRPHLKLTGISSILGLPLPNSGHLDGVPSELISTAISHVAHLLDCVSSLLNVSLTHPIRMFDSFECAISPQGDQRRHMLLCPSIKLRSDKRCMWESSLRGNSRIIGASERDATDPAALKRSARRASKKTESIPADGHSTSVKGSTPQQQRKDSIPTGTADEWIDNAEFRSALSLLQANVISLCLRVGIPPSGLWPPEALLLNMDVLRQHAVEKTKTDETLQGAVGIESFTAPSKCVFVDEDEENLTCQISSIGTTATTLASGGITSSDANKSQPAKAFEFNPIQHQLTYRYRTHRLNQLMVDLSGRQHDRATEVADDDLEIIQHSNEWQKDGHIHVPIAQISQNATQGDPKDCDWDLVDEV